MEIFQKELDLSNYVNKEMMSVCRDNNFAVKSEKILSKLNWLNEDNHFEEMEQYSQESFYSIEGHENEIKFDDSVRLIQSSNDDAFSRISSDGSNSFEPQAKSQVMSIGYSSNEEEKNNLSVRTQDSIEEKAEDSKETIRCLKVISNQKAKTPRDVKPENFTSLKRKDVIFKSILRMMRRYF